MYTLMPEKQTRILPEIQKIKRKLANNSKGCSVQAPCHGAYSTDDPVVLFCFVFFLLF